MFVLKHHTYIILSVSWHDDNSFSLICNNAKVEIYTQIKFCYFAKLTSFKCYTFCLTFKMPDWVIKYSLGIILLAKSVKLNHQLNFKLHFIKIVGACEYIFILLCTIRMPHSVLCMRALFYHSWIYNHSNSSLDDKLRWES